MLFDWGCMQLEKMAELFEVPVSALLGKPQETAEQKSVLDRISAQLAVMWKTVIQV